MSTETTPAANGALTAKGLFGVAFVVLKLTHIIDWSWWWVLSPFWLGLAFVVALLGFVMAWYVIEAWRLQRAKRKAKR